MNYLYHRIPRAKDGRSAMQGTTLYPLTELAHFYPTIYEQQRAKYEGRPRVMEQTIPLLNHAVWNSVIFMTSIHPIDLKQAFIEAGGDPSIKRSYYQIDPTQLDQDKLAVYLFAPKQTVELDDNDFAPYRYEDLETYSQVPDATKAYFQEALRHYERIPLFYRYIPHILYQGSIDVSSCPIVTD